MTTVGNCPIFKASNVNFCSGWVASSLWNRCQNGNPFTFQDNEQACLVPRCICVSGCSSLVALVRDWWFGEFNLRFLQINGKPPLGPPPNLWVDLAPRLWYARGDKGFPLAYKFAKPSRNTSNKHTYFTTQHPTCHFSRRFHYPGFDSEAHKAAFSPSRTKFKWGHSGENAGKSMKWS